MKFDVYKDAERARKGKKTAFQCTSLISCMVHCLPFVSWSLCSCLQFMHWKNKNLKCCNWWLSTVRSSCVNFHLKLLSVTYYICCCLSYFVVDHLCLPLLYNRCYLNGGVFYTRILDFSIFYLLIPIIVYFDSCSAYALSVDISTYLLRFGTWMPKFLSAFLICVHGKQQIHKNSFSGMLGGSILQGCSHIGTCVKGGEEAE